MKEDLILSVELKVEDFMQVSSTGFNVTDLCQSLPDPGDGRGVRQDRLEQPLRAVRGNSGQERVQTCSQNRGLGVSIANCSGLVKQCICGVGLDGDASGRIGTQGIPVCKLPAWKEIQVSCILLAIGKQDVPKGFKFIFLDTDTIQLLRSRDSCSRS